MKTKKYTFRNHINVSRAAMAQGPDDATITDADFIQVDNINPLAKLLGRYPQLNTERLGDDNSTIYRSEVTFGNQLFSGSTDYKDSLFSIDTRTGKPPPISKRWKMKLPPKAAARLREFDPNYWLGDAYVEIVDVEFAVQATVHDGGGNVITPADTKVQLERYEPFKRDSKGKKEGVFVASFDTLKQDNNVDKTDGYFLDKKSGGYLQQVLFEDTALQYKIREIVESNNSVLNMIATSPNAISPTPPNPLTDPEAAAGWDMWVGPDIKPADPHPDNPKPPQGFLWGSLFQLFDIKPHGDAVAPTHVLSETPPSHYHYFELPTPAFLADASPPDPLSPDLAIDQFRPTQEDRTKFDTFGRYNYLVKALELRDSFFTASSPNLIDSVIRPSSYYAYKIAKFHQKQIGIGKDAGDVVQKGSYNWKFDLLSRASQNPNDWVQDKGFYQNYLSPWFNAVPNINDGNVGGNKGGKVGGIGGSAPAVGPSPVEKFEKTFKAKVVNEVDPTPGDPMGAYNIMVRNSDYYFVRDDPFLKDVYANRNYLPFYNEIYCSFERSNSLIAEPSFSKALEEFKLRDTFLFNSVSSYNDASEVGGLLRGDSLEDASFNPKILFSADKDDAPFISGKETYAGPFEVAGLQLSPDSHLNVVKSGDRLGEYLKFFFTDGATNPAILNKNAGFLEPNTLNALADRWVKKIAHARPYQVQQEGFNLTPAEAEPVEMFVTNPFYGKDNTVEPSKGKKPTIPLVKGTNLMILADIAKNLKYRNFISRHNKTTGGEPQKSKLFKALMVNKFSQIVKDNQLTFWDSLKGKRTYAEVVGYSIQRVRIAEEQGDEQQQVEKEMFFPIDIDAEQALNIVDSDVYYDTDYYYKFYYHVASLGVATAYHQFLGFETIGQNGAPITNASKTKLKFACVSYPDLRMFKVQVGQSNVINIYDRPPVFPVIRAIPYKDKPNEVGFLFQNNSDRLKAEPIAIFKKDEALFAKARVNQKAMEGEAKSREAWEVTKQMAASMYSWVGQSSKQGYNLEFATISDLTKVEMFRLDEEPKEYADFEDAKLQIIHLDQTTGFIDKVETNKKYWYTFRTVNWHGLVSNPTAIYQVELIEHDAVRLPQIKLFEFRSPKRKEVYEFNSLLHIALSPEQMMVTDVSKANSADATTLALSDGTASQKTNLFTNKKKGKNKYIKLRLTSKSTGKVVDINLIPTLETLNYTLPPVQGFSLEKFGDLSFGDQQDIKKYFDLNFKSTNELFTRDYDDYGVSPKLINKLSDMLEHKGLDKLAVLSLIENFEKLRNKEDD